MKPFIRKLATFFCRSTCGLVAEIVRWLITMTLCLSVVFTGVYFLGEETVALRTVIFLWIALVIMLSYLDRSPIPG